MLVKNWMVTPVITIDVDATMKQAINLMTEHDISVLPVLGDEKLVGIVTDADIKSVSPSTAVLQDSQQIMYRVSRLTVGDFMTRDVFAVPLHFTVEETAQVLLKNRFTGAPVVDDQGRVQGIITKTDLFKVLIAVSGIARKGVQFAILLEEDAGKLREIADLLLARGIRIVSLMNSYEKAPEGHFYVYIRIYHPERETMFQAINEIRKKNRMIYLVDHDEDMREIFE